MFEEPSDVGVELVRLGKDRSFLSWKVGGAASLVIGLVPHQATFASRDESPGRCGWQLRAIRMITWL
ncbi:hypothetical protein, partial [Streptomyces laurentii]